MAISGLDHFVIGRSTPEFGPNETELGRVIGIIIMAGFRGNIVGLLPAIIVSAYFAGDKWMDRGRYVRVLCIVSCFLVTFSVLLFVRLAFTTNLPFLATP